MADYAFGFNPPCKLQQTDVAARLHSLMHGSAAIRRIAAVNGAR
jgi:hypothetical protein